MVSKSELTVVEVELKQVRVELASLRVLRSLPCAAKWMR